MSYIQNKLDEFENKFTDTELGNFYSTVTTWKHTIGMPVHVKMFIEQAITEAYNKGQTDYHNHIVEKVKNEPNPFMGENDKKDHHTGWEYAKKDILSLLQDTNPKE